MLTIGVDLAAEPKGTALAAIEWSGSSAVVSDLLLGVADSAIVERSREAHSVGIDCPFGWPIEFVDFVALHARNEVAPRALTGSDWRRRLAYRETDRDVRRRTGKTPLSVSTDRLGLTAMRCAELLERFSSAGERIDRSGSSRLVEVYPGAALRIWEIEVAGYKREQAALVAAAGKLLDAAPWLDASDAVRALMSRSHDAFDAVIAALNARAHALGLTHSAPDEFAEQARIEGWIGLPSTGLGVLQ